MSTFWDHFGFSRHGQQSHNLQDGLFQIASQTCSILVKVNNTNNICCGNDSSNVHFDFSGLNGRAGQEKLLVPATKKSSAIFGCKKKLSTVLESSSFGNASNVDDDFDQWEQSFMLRQDQGSINCKNGWGTDNWCRPSCIPISFILVLIVLVVLVPLLDHTNSGNSIAFKLQDSYVCSDKCSLSLVESIPEGMLFPGNSTLHKSTHDSWLNLIDMAHNTIEIASFYWTLRENEVYPYNSSVKGEEVFKALLTAGTNRGINVNIVQSIPTKENPNIDTETLMKKKAAQVRSVNFPKLIGGGVLHTKLWLVDRSHFYIGSANMDWRSLTHVKELGILGINCSCLALDMGKIFDVYWMLGDENASIPNMWPSSLNTNFNSKNPMHLNISNYQYMSYISSSPPPLSPFGRTNDLEAIVNTIRTAEKFVYISVMDYYPLMLYTPKRIYWPHIDDAIRSVAIEGNIQIKMLISHWNHSHRSENNFLKSLSALNKSYAKVDIQVKRFVVPATEEQKKIPFARVNHNKYMVTDNTAYIGTSNWSGDYFVNTAGVAIILEEPDHSIFPSKNSNISIRQQLQDIFERDWNSDYASQLI